MSLKVLILENNDGKFEHFKEVLTISYRMAKSPIQSDQQNLPKGYPTFSFVQANDGDEALRLVDEAVRNQQPFCLAVMDLQQARLNGSFFYPRELRKIDQDLQMIITVNPDDPYWVKLSEHVGRRDFILFLSKPYRPIELQQSALVLCTKWQKDHVAEKSMAQYSEAYELMAIEKMKADQENSSKTTFLASMSHEVRTPLNILLGILEVLQGTELNEEQAYYVDMANRSGETLLLLLNTLLNLSKLEAGQDADHPVPFSLTDFLQDLFKFFSFKAQRNNVSFTSHIGDDIPKHVCADKEKLNIILTNLLDNAIKFSPNGKVSLSVKAETTIIHDRIHVSFVVEDTGIGIPDEERHLIFKKFYQVKSNTSQDFKGTGLGLSLTNQYVALMGGDITVKSTLGKGSCFKVTLPLRICPDQGAGAGGAKAKQKLKLKRPMNILLVEDNPDNVLLMRIFFKNEACQLDVAENGKVAVEKFQHQHYDVVFMDMEMPVMDGFEATQTIRALEKDQQRPPTPIIALTAFSRDNELQACKNVGCDDIFKKPVTRAKLMAYLEQIACTEHHGV